MLRKATIALSAILGIACGCALLASVGGSKTYEFSPKPLERYRIAISGGWFSVAGVRLPAEFFARDSGPREATRYVTDAVYRDGTYYGTRGRDSLALAVAEFLRLEANSPEATSPAQEVCKASLDVEPVVGASLIVPEFSYVPLGDDAFREVQFAVRLPLWMPTVAFLIYPVVAFLRGPVRRHKRRKSGRCPRCGYDLTANATGVCPECGREFASNR